MFPHPFQMALMGYWLSESRHRDLAEYARRLEMDARRLEQNLETVARNRNAWAHYARRMENRATQLAQELEEAGKEMENLKMDLENLRREMEERTRIREASMNRWIAKHRVLVRDAAKLKAFLREFFGDHAPKLLTPLGMKHRDMVLRFLRRLPDDPEVGPDP